MKSQRALRLRQAGRHHAHRRSDVDWVWRFNLGDSLRRAFEMNVQPRHYAPEPGEVYQQQTYTTMANYLTGQSTRNQGFLTMNIDGNT